MNELIEGHSFRRFDGELKHLHYLVLEMGELVISQVEDSIEAFRNRDGQLAQQVISRDQAVDRLEVDGDAAIIQVIARHCPVGSDLRMVLGVSKSVSDLERIGDEAVRIAGLAIQLFGPERGDHNSQLIRNVNTIGGMAMASLKAAVNLFASWSENKAYEVIISHREMDLEFQSDLRRLMTFVMEDSRTIGEAINVVLVIKALERIGHHAQNLAENVIFQIQGKDIRHLKP